MRTIWKYVISEHARPQSFQIPFGGKLCHVDVDPQGVGPAMWFEIDTEHTSETRSFIVLGTGDPISKGFEHIGTLRDVAWIWHVFEVHAYKVSA